MHKRRSSERNRLTCASSVSSPAYSANYFSNANALARAGIHAGHFIAPAAGALMFSSGDLHRHRNPSVLPCEHKVGGVRTFVLERNSELLNRSLDLALLHVNADQVLVFIVNRAPLAGLLVDDQLPRAL